MSQWICFHTFWTADLWLLSSYPNMFNPAIVPILFYTTILWNSTCGGDIEIEISSLVYCHYKTGSDSVFWIQTYQDLSNLYIRQWCTHWDYFDIRMHCGAYI